MVLKDGTLQTLSKKNENEESKKVFLLERESFIQTHFFPLSSSILTPEFVAEYVGHPETQALLSDLRQPHSQLVATIGDKRLHIFD